MLKKDLIRMEFFALKESLRKLDEQKTEKENRLADNSLSFPQLRDKLLQQVKRVKGTDSIIQIHGFLNTNSGFVNVSCIKHLSYIFLGFL